MCFLNINVLYIENRRLWVNFLVKIFNRLLIIGSKEILSNNVLLTHKHNEQPSKPGLKNLMKFSTESAHRCIERHLFCPPDAHLRSKGENAARQVTLEHRWRYFCGDSPNFVGKRVLRVHETKHFDPVVYGTWLKIIISDDKYVWIELSEFYVGK